MKKEFILYELALKMKQLGFNERCIMHWWKGRLSYYRMGDFSPTHTSAPTYSQAFRWFREKGFLIDVTSLSKDEYEFYIKWSFAYSFLSDTYKTYEEAEIACLKKLIEIAEQKENI